MGAFGLHGRSNFPENKSSSQKYNRSNNDHFNETHLLLLSKPVIGFLLPAGNPSLK
jgi:hypothetical protein